MGQLKDVATQRAGLSEVIEAETKDDPASQRRTGLNRAISLPTHAAVIRDLSSALKNLITLERQVYNLDASGKDPAPARRRNPTTTPASEQLAAILDLLGVA